MKTIVRYFSVIILLSQIQCTSPTEPPKPDEIKDPVDYTWTIDTLQYTPFDQTTMRSIWGNASDNIYVVGHCSNSNGQMWHYNGIRWTTISLPYANRTLAFIWGNTPTNIWAVGSKGGVTYDSNYAVHFDGVSWKEESINGGHYLLSIWGTSKTNIWIGGINNLYHYDGKTWDSFISYNNSSYDFQFISISGLSADDIYFIQDDLTQYPNFEYYYLYQYNGVSSSVIDSTNVPPPHRFGGNLKTIDGVLYSAGYGLFKKNINSWSTILNDTKIFRVDGSNSNNIFAAGDGQSIYYFDGTNWQNLIPFPNFNAAIYAIQVFDNEVFFVAHDGWKTYILHGK